MKQAHSELKKIRTMNFFLDAAETLAQVKGFQNLSTRTVAEEAGYNSATLYHYFENFNQLIAFAVIRNLSEYLNQSMEVIEHITDPFEDYVQLWRIFCSQAFANPIVFKYAFMSNKEIMDNIQSNTKAYYDIFGGYQLKTGNAYFDANNEDMNIHILESFIKMGLFSKDIAEDVYEFGNYLFHGILYEVDLNADKTPEEYTEKFLKYFIPYLQMRINK